MGGRDTHAKPDTHMEKISLTDVQTRQTGTGGSMETAGLVQTKKKKVHHPSPWWAKLWADKALVGPGDGLRVQKGSRFGSINIGCTEMTSSRGTSPRGTEMTDMALKCAPCSWVS